MILLTRILSVCLLLICYKLLGANALRCGDTSMWAPYTKYCEDYEYCCGLDNSECCTPDAIKFVQVFVVLFFSIFICTCCYRCCCRRTASRGFVYQPAPAMTVTVQPPLAQPLPYPTMPFPQQTPYPQQYSTNPYYNQPPPAYNTIHEQHQSASAPPPFVQN